MTTRSTIAVLALALTLVVGLGTTFAILTDARRDGLGDQGRACGAIASFARSQGLRNVVVSPDLLGLPDRGDPYSTGSWLGRARNTNFRRLHAVAEVVPDIGRPLDCSAAFKAAGLAIDPGRDVRTARARGPEQRSELMWFSRPLFLGRLMLVRQGRVLCASVGGRLGLDVNIDSEPRTMLVEKTLNGWRRTTSEASEILLLRPPKPIEACPAPQDAAIPARWRPWIRP